MLVVKSPPASAGDTRDLGTTPGSRRSPGGRNGNPLQYYCLGKPMDRGAWSAAVHSVTESDTTERFHAGSKNLEHMKKLQTSSKRTPPKKCNKWSRVSHTLCVSLFFSVLPEPHDEIPSWDQICCQHDWFLHLVCINCRHPAVRGPLWCVIYSLARQLDSCWHFAVPPLSLGLHYCQIPPWFSALPRLLRSRPPPPPSPWFTCYAGSQGRTQGRSLSLGAFVSLHHI